MTTVPEAISLAMEMFNTEYPGKFSVPPRRIELWERMLGEFDPEVILHAAYHLVGLSEWPPNIHQMRKQCISFAFGEISDPSGEEAWAKIMKKIQHAESIELSEIETEALTQTATIFDMRQSSNIESHRARYITAFERLVAKRNEERLTMPEIREFIGLKSLPGKK